MRRFAAWWKTTTVEKFLEDVVFLLKNAALLDIINLVAGVTIIISLGTWWTGRKESLEDDRISAFLTWAEINESGKHPEMARLALQRLVEKNISLKKLDLQKANLGYANLQESHLGEANLQESHLGDANLQKANLIRAKLQKANLEEAKLQKANLGYANLQEARLWKANLQEARLWKANLQESHLWKAKNLTHKQIKSACNWEKGIYKGQWNSEKGLAETIEPDNTNFIEDLKKDKSSDPKKAPDCSIWDNKE